MTTLVRRRHPLHAAGVDVRELRSIVAKGESAAMLPILIGGWLFGVACLVGLVVALAFGVAYLATGSTGATYPSPGGSAAQPLQTSASSGTSGKSSSSTPSSGEKR